MTAGVFVMLLGVFGVPAALLWAGHRMRRRSRAWHNAFWGAIVGHLTAIVIGLVAAMTPPQQWGTGDLWRGVFGFWSFLLFPAIGAMFGLLSARASAR
jgi:hypothetical protein